MTSNILERVLAQYDTLIPFLQLMDEEVFNVLRRQYGEWHPDWREDGLPQTFALYQKQVAHAAFLLGYSYHEAFLSDLIREIYKCKPRMLPSDKTVKVSEIVERSDYDSILDLMIDKEIFAILHDPRETIADCFDKRFSLKWPSESKDRAVESLLLRNCIIHNNAIVDSRLAKSGNWQVGDSLSLRFEDVHLFGLDARKVAHILYEQADKAFFSRRTS